MDSDASSNSTRCQSGSYATGISVERVDPATPATDPSNWSSSLDQFYIVLLEAVNVEG